MNHIKFDSMLGEVSFPVCHGLEREGATTQRVMTTVPSRAEVRLRLIPKRAAAKSHGLPPSWLAPNRRRFRRQTVAQVLNRMAFPPVGLRGHSVV